MSTFFRDTLYIKKLMRTVGFTAKDVVCLCSADSSALWSIGAHPPPLSSPVLLPKTHYTLLVLLRPLLAAGLLPLAPLFPIIPLLLHSPPYGEICCTSFTFFCDFRCPFWSLYPGFQTSRSPFLPPASSTSGDYSYSVQAGVVHFSAPSP